MLKPNSSNLLNKILYEKRQIFTLNHPFLTVAENSEILIPTSQLQSGFDECRKQIETLIDSAQILYDKRKFSISLPLLILAREEYAKLTLFLMHIVENDGITKKEWLEYTRGGGVHSNKLTGVVKKAKKRIERDGPEKYEEMQEFYLKKGFGTRKRVYEDTVSINPQTIENLNNLNTIKQDCFYLDWQDGEWNIITKRSNRQLKALVYTSMTSIQQLLYGHIFMNCLDRIQKNQDINEDFSEFNDYYGKWQKKKQELASKKFLEKLKITHVVLQEYSEKKKSKLKKI